MQIRMGKEHAEHSIRQWMFAQIAVIPQRRGERVNSTDCQD